MKQMRKPIIDPYRVTCIMTEIFDGAMKSGRTMAVMDATLFTGMFTYR